VNGVRSLAVVAQREVEQRHGARLALAAGRPPGVMELLYPLAGAIDGSICGPFSAGERGPFSTGPDEKPIGWSSGSRLTFVERAGRGR